VVTLKMALPAGPTVATAPLTKSLPKMLPAFAVPLAPLMPVLKVSFAAVSVETGTTTVVVSGLQLLGFNFSHKLDTML
jgi:hypothetical protein